MQSLLSTIDNEFQRNALQTLLAHDESSHIYLSSYEKNTSSERRLDGLEGTFTVLGSLRAAGRESYSVKFFKPYAHDKGSFWCSCPSHKFNSSKKNMVCKHICFLVCRVGRIYETEFFRTKQFTAAKFSEFLQRVENSAIFSDQSICRASSEVVETTLNIFRTPTKEITSEDPCPICCDEMDVESAVCCPSCNNNIHKVCMEVWLERNHTCVFCRSDVWRRYKK